MNWKAYLQSAAVWIHAGASLVGGAVIAGASLYLQTGGAIPATSAQWHSAAATISTVALGLMAAHLKPSPIAPTGPAEAPASKGPAE